MAKAEMPINQDGRSILVADDEEGICNILRKVFGKDGYQVVVSSNGREALAALKDKREISLAIMDINMPEMDGLETLSVIRGEGIQLPVIMITGEESTRCLEEAKRLEVFAYLTKPFEIKEIKRLVKAALETV